MGAGGGELGAGNCACAGGTRFNGATTPARGVGCRAGVGRASDVSETTTTPATTAEIPASALPANTKGLLRRMLLPSSSSASSSRTL
jgi:hypothetical protein